MYDELFIQVKEETLPGRYFKCDKPMKGDGQSESERERERDREEELE